MLPPLFLRFTVVPTKFSILTHSTVMTAIITHSTPSPRVSSCRRRLSVTILVFKKPVSILRFRTMLWLFRLCGFLLRLSVPCLTLSQAPGSFCRPQFSEYLLYPPLSLFEGHTALHVCSGRYHCCGRQRRR